MSNPYETPESDVYTPDAAKPYVIDANSGGRLAVGQMLLRYLGYYIGLIPLGLVFFGLAGTKRNRVFTTK
jgi:hypothetical protein